jgi:hypothetical protein
MELNESKRTFSLSSIHKNFQIYKNVLFDFMGFYFNNGINRQNDKEHTIYFHVLFKALKLFPVVGIILLLPF